jgi:hypothetical protein
MRTNRTSSRVSVVPMTLLSIGHFAGFSTWFRGQAGEFAAQSELLIFSGVAAFDTYSQGLAKMEEPLDGEEWEDRD